MRKRNLLVVILLTVLVFAAIAPLILGVVITWRIAHTLHQHHPSGYAILRMHQDRESVRRYDGYRKIATVISAWRERREDPYDRPDRPNHVAILLTDNQWVYVYHWSFRSFNLETSLVSQIAAMREDVQPLYRYTPDEVMREGRLPFIEAVGDEVAFYYHPGRGGEGPMHRWCEPPFIPPSVVKSIISPTGTSAKPITGYMSSWLDGGGLVQASNPCWPS